MEEGRKEVQGTSEKPGLKQKIRSTFIPEDVTNVGLYLLTDWVLPNVWDFIQSGVNSVIKKPHGSGSSNMANLSGKPSAVAKIQQQVAYNKRWDQVHGASRSAVDIGNYDYIKIMDRADAEMVRMEMIDIIGDEEEGQGKVSIGWFLDRCQIPGIPAAAWNWGWRNLDYSRVEKFENGWRIVFPKAVSLK